VENKHLNINRPKRIIFTNNFIGGIAWGLGVTVGLSFFIGILAFVGSRIDLVPVVGDFASKVINYIIINSGQIPGR
jgi:hypothetical protein